MCGGAPFCQITLITPLVNCARFCLWRRQSLVFGRPFVKRFALCYRSVVCLSVLSVLSVCLSVTVYSGQTVGWIKMKLGTEVGLGPGHIVLDGNPAPSPHVCCGQTAGWIKMPLGTEVDLGPDDIIVDVDPSAPAKKGGRSPHFLVHVLWPNVSMDQDATGIGSKRNRNGPSIAPLSAFKSLTH